MKETASWTERRPFAFELKFLIPASIADQVESWARAHLAPDPNANGSIRGSYRINSLYFDTAALDVYRRVGSYARSKYRLRRYGDEQFLFLERKLKTSGQVTKRRTRIPETEMHKVSGSLPQKDWPGCWFHRRLITRRLIPKCQIAYDRTAFVGANGEPPIRLTMDRNIRCQPAQMLDLVSAVDGPVLLEDQRILELKFQLSLPQVFKHLIQEFGLSPQAVSKYRLGMESLGLTHGLLPAAEPTGTETVTGTTGAVIVPITAAGNLSPAAENP